MRSAREYVAAEGGASSPGKRPGHLRAETGKAGYDGGHETGPRPQVNIRQANGLGRVHVAKPGMKQTYCGRQIDEEDWVTTSREANCTGCARAGAPGPEKPARGF